MVQRRAALLDGRAGGRVLGDLDLEGALAVCAKDAVGSVLATARLEQAVGRTLRAAGGTLWGYEEDGELLAICFAGANMVPVVPVEDPHVVSRALDAFAGLARGQGRRCSSIVGNADAVLGLWGRLRYFWPAAREVRDDQPSMVIEHAPLVTADPRVRRSRPEEFEVVLPACVRMFTEEVGYSPVSGPGGPYESRVHGLISQGRSFVRIDQPDAPTDRRLARRASGDVVFKAELGAVAGGVAQVQGVWVAPHRRGERLSESGMSAVVQIARAEVAPLVSLYVNSYNERALASYRAVGFRQVGTYATVLF